MEYLNKYNNLISRFSGLKKIIFCLTLTIELLLMVYEKSELPLPTPSYVFRVTFALSVLAVLLTEYSVRQWILIIMATGFSFFCYKVTGNNDLIRFAMFIAASKDSDLEKTLRYIFAVTGISYLIIFFASVFGIYGGLYSTGEFGRSVGVETRYVFGFGHPNTAHGAFMGLAILGLYLVRNLDKKKKALFYAITLVLNCALYAFTDSRTGLVMVTFAVMLSLMTFWEDKFRDSIAVYAMGACTLVCSIAFSIWAACISYYTKFNELYYKIDMMFTGRIGSLYYNSLLHKGSIISWTLLGNSDSGESYFDMGWVRLFYWYGVIPATIILIFLFVILYRMYKRRDLAMLIMFVSLFIYTIIEATFISSYIGRNYLLPVIGIYLFNRYGEGNIAGKE